MSTMYTLKEVLNATGGKPAFVQNIVTRGIVQLQQASTLGKQIKRRYTLRDACSIGYLVEVTRLKIPPTIAAQCLEDVYSVVSKLALGEAIMKSGILQAKDFMKISWEPKNSKIFIFYPTDKKDEWEKTEAHMDNGQIYYREGPDFEKQIELFKKYETCSIEECEDAEMRQYKEYLIQNGTFNEKDYESLAKDHAKTNDPELQKSFEVREDPFDLSDLPDCFIVLQVDRLIRRIFRKLKAFD